MKPLLLDTNLLGQICHPNADQFKEIKSWVYSLLRASGQIHYQIFLPEIADYELRRKLLHLAYQQGRTDTQSLHRLNQYQKVLNYLPLQTTTFQRAAELWAEARLRGLATASPEMLDGDVILAAQAQEVKGTVLTTNKKHLSRFVAVSDWQDFLI